ncbi:MAG: nucleotidyltransferase domain-containing protein [Verrucomicrobiales bacterium]|jgi:predicted nucleotidyltransferase|nr:nucleotidyltransferase domain-containing protein [Verrucomicrobiales bacterium]
MNDQPQNKVMERLRGAAVRDFCRANAIRKLEVFGSVARGEAVADSDVDLIAAFDRLPGLRLVELQEEIGRLLGMTVDFLSAGAVDAITNPFRRAAIAHDRCVVYET